MSVLLRIIGMVIVMAFALSFDYLGPKMAKRVSDRGWFWVKVAWITIPCILMLMITASWNYDSRVKAARFEAWLEEHGCEPDPEPEGLEEFGDDAWACEEYGSCTYSESKDIVRCALLTYHDPPVVGP